VIAARAAELPAILTTQRLEMGVNTPGKKIVIFSRPPDMPHNVVQGMGRAGRPLDEFPGMREKTLVYIFSNSYDLNTSKAIMKELCLNKDTCLKDILGKYFTGDYKKITKVQGWCCSNCD
jgi:superfamily II DNA helicase RecQ